jgi:hypothetical protein
VLFDKGERKGKKESHRIGGRHAVVKVFGNCTEVSKCLSAKVEEYQSTKVEEAASYWLLAMENC